MKKLNKKENGKTVIMKNIEVLYLYSVNFTVVLNKLTFLRPAVMSVPLLMEANSAERPSSAEALDSSFTIGGGGGMPNTQNKSNNTNKSADFLEHQEDKFTLKDNITCEVVSTCRISVHKCRGEFVLYCIFFY